MDEIAANDTKLRGRSPSLSSMKLARSNGPCNEKAPEGTPIMHSVAFKKGKGKFVLTEYVPTDERSGPAV